MARRAKKLNRENASLKEIEKARNYARAPEDYKILVVIEYLRRGYDRQLVEELTKFGASTVRKLVGLFNSRGIDGIVTKPRPGRSRKVSHAEFAEKIVPLIEYPEQHGFPFMTIVKLHGNLTSRMNYEVSYRSVLR